MLDRAASVNNFEDLWGTDKKKMYISVQWNNSHKCSFNENICRTINARTKRNYVMYLIRSLGLHLICCCILFLARQISFFDEMSYSNIVHCQIWLQSHKQPGRYKDCKYKQTMTPIQIWLQSHMTANRRC
jgi:hypothetical protein